MRRLRAFVTVADLGGISVAAERLGYAQSSLSAQLRALEVELGGALLRRTNAGASPTEAGERLLPLAREAMDLDDRMRRAVTGDRPTLRIGTLETLADEWLPDLLTAFEHRSHRAGSDVARTAADVRLTVGSRPSLSADLEAGRLDLVFLFDNGTATTASHQVVDHDDVLLLAAPEHPLGRTGSATTDDLRLTGFLVAEPGCTTQMLVDRMGRDLLLEAPLSMVTGSLPALRRMATNGAGVALLPQLAAARYLDCGELVRIALPDALPTISIEARWGRRLGVIEPTVLSLVELALRSGRARRTAEAAERQTA